MAVANSDLKFYLSANRPETDAATSGGARDANMQGLQAASADIGGAGDTINVDSTNAGDTQNVSIAGYGAGGAWLTETLALTGTTDVDSANTYLYVCKIELASDAIGTITVTQTSTPANVIHVIPIGERGAARLFLKAAANAAGGATKYFYEKVFVGNGHASDGVVNATVALTVNTESEIAGACEKAATVQVTDGTESVANRLTAPTGGGSYTFGDMVTPVDAGNAGDGNLIAAEYQGVWLKLTLAAGNAPVQASAFTLQLAGDAS